MKLKIKMGNILHLNAALKLIIDDTANKMDVSFKFKLLGIMKSIQPHIDNFNIIRNEKIKEYGNENEDGTVEIETSNKEIMNKFNKDMSELLETTVNLDIDKLKAEEVFNQRISSEYLVALYEIMEG